MSARGRARPPRGSVRTSPAGRGERAKGREAVQGGRGVGDAGAAAGGAQVVQSSHEVFMLGEWLSFRSSHYLCDTLVSVAISHLLLDDLDDALLLFVRVRLPFRGLESCILLMGCFKVLIPSFYRLVYQHCKSTNNVLRFSDRNRTALAAYTPKR